MSNNTNYFATGILGLGGWIERGLIAAYFGRVFIMAMGFMWLEFLLAMNLDLDEVFNTLHLFTGKVVEGGAETLQTVGWVLFLAFVLHYLAFFAIGWNGFKKSLNGDEVAKNIFEDLNTTIIPSPEREGAHDVQ